MVESYEPDGELKKLKPAPANMLKVRAGIVDETRKRARERTALEAKRKRDRERELAAKAAAASSTKRAKKSAELSAVPPSRNSGRDSRLVAARIGLTTLRLIGPAIASTR